MAALHGSLSRLVQAVNEESQARLELRFVARLLDRRRGGPGDPRRRCRVGSARSRRRRAAAKQTRRSSPGGFSRRGQPEDAAMEPRRRAVEAEGLVGLLLQARAIVLRAGAVQRPALGDSDPARAMLAKVSSLCLVAAAGQADRRRARSGEPTDQPAFLRRRYSGRNDCSASASLNGESSARRKNARCGASAPVSKA